MIDYDTNQHYSTKTASPPPHPTTITATTSPTRHLQKQQQQDYPSDLLDSLRQHSLFQRTNNEAFLTKLASGMLVRIYNVRDIIINKGESSKAMFFLLRGEVDVCSADFERIYATLSQGTCFGEIGILYAMPRTASVVANTKCTVAILTSDQVHTLLPQFPDVDKIIRFEAEERLAVMDKMDSRQHQNDDTVNELEKQQEQQSFDSSSTLPTATPATTTISEQRQRTSSVQYNVEAFSKTGIRTHLDKIPFLFGCSEDFLHLICLSIQPRNYEPNTVIFNQGDQGDEMYFIVDGFVDIEKGQSHIYGRLGPGGYFGDTSVLLNLRRPATIKTATQVECYVLNRTNLQQACNRFPDHGYRLKALTEARLNDITKGKFDELSGSRPITTDDIQPQSSLVCRTTCDQDPTLPITPASQIRKTETRRRRPSIAVWGDPLLAEISRKATLSEQEQQSHHLPPTPHLYTMMDGTTLDHQPSRKPSVELPPSPSWATSPISTSSPPASKDMHDVSWNHRTPAADRLTILDPPLLIHLMTFLDFGTLIEMMRLNKSVYAIFSLGNALEHLDLSTLHKKITDDTFTFLMSFLRHRLHSLSLSQCFHLTDLGFRSLLLDDDDLDDTATTSPPPSPPPLTHLEPTSSLTKSHRTLQHLHSLNLNSCWLLTDQSLQLIGERCPQLVRLDLSNCRKITNSGIYRLLKAQHTHHTTGDGIQWLSLSYCKNLTDVTMQHLADYTSDTLMYLNLQRCTKITDMGFQYWAQQQQQQQQHSPSFFARLHEVILVDCSFLTDRAIQLLAQSAVHLQHVALSFCCSLSDGVMLPLAQLACLTDLDVSYCGAAVSDMSLRHLLLSNVCSLQRLNLRGCVRVTGQGLLASLLLLSSTSLRKQYALLQLNISQCPSIPSETKHSILDRALVQHLII